MKWLVAFLILLAPLIAQAIFFHGTASGAAACPNPTGSGSVIVAPTSCYLTGDGWNWSFSGSPDAYGNYQLTYDSSGVSAVEAERAADTHIYWQRHWPTCGTLWAWTAYPHVDWATAPGTLVSSVGNYFADTTKGTYYAGIGALLNAASNGDTLSISQQPAAYGFSCWPLVIGISQNSLTLNIASGTVFGDAPVLTSTGLLVIGTATVGVGTNATVNGGNFVGPVRIKDNATNPTLENMVVHDGCASIGTSCILTGAYNGTVTLTNVTVYGGSGGGTGQNHNVYISATAAGDSAASAQITNLSSYDIGDGGWPLKLRPEGINTQNHITESYIFCTKATGGGSGCEQNGVVDMPCSGNFLIDYSVLERGPAGDNGYVVRVGEESRNGTDQCPVAYAPTNNIVLDHDIIIWDGGSPGWAVTDVVCIAGHDGSGNCDQSSIPTGQTCTISNSVLVSDSASGITLVRGAGCMDGGGNRVYANRAAAAAGEGWSGNDRFTHPCCAFPWVPPYLGEH